MQDIAIRSRLPVEDSLEVIRACLHSGDHAMALRCCAELLPEAGDYPAAYECAAQTFIAAINSGNGLQDLEPEMRHRLLSSMVSQPLCASSPPVLHHQLAAQHSSGMAIVLERAAKVLLPIIQAMLAGGEVNKNLVLLILLLRPTSLGKRIGQREISRLHLAWIARFTLGDLAIPYNSMFDARSFKRNIADIAAYLKDIRAARDAATICRSIIGSCSNGCWPVRSGRATRNGFWVWRSSVSGRLRRPKRPLRRDHFWSGTGVGAMKRFNGNWRRYPARRG